MIGWAKSEGLTIVKDEKGEYDWHAVYREWAKRVEAEDDDGSN